ncbi:hypothetical protein D3C81_1583570 [compost metagenome]
MGGIRKNRPIKKVGIFAEKPGFKYVIWSIDPELVGRGRRCRQIDGAFLYLCVDHATTQEAGTFRPLFKRSNSALHCTGTVPGHVPGEGGLARWHGHAANPARSVALAARTIRITTE